ncbi:MAG TPA: hypothetical protein DCE42_25350 [Myxococcales bacterium]|nr:hypothetical protein [Deltaproteobacteria bacterium]MBU47643.1 hypothetical protein [Deltaproteobacteria bacterium]HAA58114.1 hypothetical protein [Myxococcales bacterium]
MFECVCSIKEHIFAVLLYTFSHMKTIRLRKKSQKDRVFSAFCRGRVLVSYRKIWFVSRSLS